MRRQLEASHLTLLVAVTFFNPSSTTWNNLLTVNINIDKILVLAYNNGKTTFYYQQYYFSSHEKMNYISHN